MPSIQYKIEKLIESKNLTKSAFAKAVGIHIDTVYNLKDETIKVSTLLKISEVLGVDVMYFFQKKETKPAAFNKYKAIEFLYPGYKKSK